MKRNIPTNSLDHISDLEVARFKASLKKAGFSLIDIDARYEAESARRKELADSLEDYEEIGYGMGV